MKKILALSLLFVSTSILTMQQPPEDRPVFENKQQEKIYNDAMSKTSTRLLVMNLVSAPFVLMTGPAAPAILLSQYVAYKSVQAVELYNEQKPTVVDFKKKE